MKNRRTWLAAGIAVALAGLGVGLGAYAQTGTQDLQPPHLIPYQGYLEDGQGPVNATADAPLAVTFFITTGPEDAYTDTCNAVSGCIWQETDSLVVANGYFSTVLGDDPLSPLNGKFAGQNRYLGIRIGGVTLDGRQQLLASPYAITAATANNFRVEGTLSTGSTVTVNGTGDVRVAGGIRAGGTADVPTGDIVASGSLTFVGKLNGLTISPEYTPGLLQTTPLSMTPAADSICFLTNIHILEATTEETIQAGCRIYQDAGNWVLQKNDMWGCTARCLRWD